MLGGNTLDVRIHRVPRMLLRSSYTDLDPPHSPFLDSYDHILVSTIITIRYIHKIEAPVELRSLAGDIHTALPTRYRCTLFYLLAISLASQALVSALSIRRFPRLLHCFTFSLRGSNSQFWPAASSIVGNKS